MELAGFIGDGAVVGGNLCGVTALVATILPSEGVGGCAFFGVLALLFAAVVWQFSRKYARLEKRAANEDDAQRVLALLSDAKVLEVSLQSLVLRYRSASVRYALFVGMTTLIALGMAPIGRVGSFFEYAQCFIPIVVLVICLTARARLTLTAVGELVRVQYRLSLLGVTLAREDHMDRTPEFCGIDLCPGNSEATDARLWVRLADGTRFSASPTNMPTWAPPCSWTFLKQIARALNAWVAGRRGGGGPM